VEVRRGRPSGMGGEGEDGEREGESGGPWRWGREAMEPSPGLTAWRLTCQSMP